MEKLGRYLRNQKRKEGEQGCRATSISRSCPLSLGGLEEERASAKDSLDLSQVGPDICGPWRVPSRLFP